MMLLNKKEINMDDLTQEYLQSILHYDVNTGNFTWKIWRGGTARVGALAGKLEKYGYIRIRVGKKLYLAHRLAWFYVHGVWPPHTIDHINRDPLDNRIENLRLATPAENSQNISLSAINSSGATGVSLRKKTNKWRAYITKNYKQIHIGFFDNLNDAIEAREKAVLKYHTYGNIK